MGVSAVQLLPLALAILAAVMIAPAALRALAHGELTHENYRGVRLPYPAGGIIVAAAALALIPCTLVQHVFDDTVFRPELGLVMFYALGVIAAITIYGEFRSISRLIERVPLLRQLDSAGRPTHA